MIPLLVFGPLILAALGYLVFAMVENDRAHRDYRRALEQQYLARGTATAPEDSGGT